MDQFAKSLRFLWRRIPSQRGEAQPLDLLGFGIAAGRQLFEERAAIHAQSVLCQVAVHHQQSLRDAALEVDGFIVLVGLESVDELLQPLVPATVVVAGGERRVVRSGREQQRIIQLLGGHPFDVDAAEQRRNAGFWIVLVVRFAEATGTLVGVAQTNPADQLLAVITAGDELPREMIE